MSDWTLFYHPMTLPFKSLLWLMLPLCLAVAVIYKTVRATNLRGLCWQVMAMMGYILAGLTALGAVLWLIEEFWP